MAGFADVPQTCIQVYYPKDGVSPVQERQMVTQEGENVDVRAVIGNFDDAQAGVKRIFSDEAVRAELDKRGYFLSSANSINWGRIQMCIRDRLYTLEDWENRPWLRRMTASILKLGAIWL